MEITKAILVVLDKKFLRNALTILNYRKAFPYVILMDGDEKFIALNDKVRISVMPFASLNQILFLKDSSLWLICGNGSGKNAPAELKNFLMANGVPENNIVNFEVTEQINPQWLANVRYVEENAIDSFATGNDLAVYGIDFKNILGVTGVNLATANQDLRQSYLIAQHVFKHSKHGAIKFVFIGLAPYSLRVDCHKNFSTCADDISYALALREEFTISSSHDKSLANLLADNADKIFSGVTGAQADLNFDSIKSARDKIISADKMTTWEEELAALTKPFDADIVEDNLRVLEDYVKLCVDNGAKPIAVLFPFVSVLKENYSREILMPLRRELLRLESVYNLTTVDMFDAQADYDCFSDLTHLNSKGAALASAAINFRLHAIDFLPLDKISHMNYEEIFYMSNFLSKDAYNDSIEKYFNLAVKKIRGKKKIRIGFVSDDPSMWCGDFLFNLFARNKRCETTFFLCLQKSLRNQPLIIAE